MPRVAPLLLLALAVGSLGCDDGPAPRAWTLVYHMPYDNDLERAADPILAELERALPPSGVAVVALVDRRGPGGLERHVIAPEGHAVERLPGDGGADVAELAALLRWVEAHQPAARYGVFLLGHGGPVGRGSYDALPSDANGPRWMETAEAAGAIAELRRSDGEVELLFLQQCGRGEISTYVSAAPAARVVMASQASIGAPNHYYSGMLGMLGARPEAVDGEALARAVMGHESPRMFVAYTALRASRLPELVGRVNDARAALDALPGAVVAGPLPPPTYEWEHESTVDLVDHLRRLHVDNGLDVAPVDALERFVAEELRVARRVSPRHPAAQPWSGISVRALASGSAPLPLDPPQDPTIPSTP